MKPRRKSQKQGPVVGGLRPRNFRRSIAQRQTAMWLLMEEATKKENKANE